MVKEAPQKVNNAGGAGDQETPEKQRIKEKVQGYIHAVNEVSPEAARKKIKEMTDAFRTFDAVLSLDEGEIIGLAIGARHLKEYARRMRELRTYAHDMVTRGQGTEEIFPLIRVLMKEFSDHGLEAREEDIETVKNFMADRHTASFVLADAGSRKALFAYSHLYPEEIERLINDDFLFGALRAYCPIGAFFAYAENYPNALRALCKKARTENDSRPWLIEAMTNPSVAYVFYERAAYFPDVLPVLWRTPELKPAFLVEGARMIIDYSSFYPEIAEEMLKEEDITKILIAGHGTSLLVNGANFPEALRAIFMDPSLGPALLRDRGDTFFNHLKEYPAAAEVVATSEKYPASLRKNTATILHYRSGINQETQGTPFSPPSGENLLRKGAHLQKLEKDSYAAFWNSVKEIFNIEVDPHAAVSFGFEIEPETGGRVMEEMEFRSFAVTDPASIPNLLNRYADYLHRCFPNAPPHKKSYGAILGTMHFNTVLAPHESLTLKKQRNKFEETAGALICATAPPSRIREGITGALETEIQIVPKEYLSEDGSAHPVFKSTLPHVYENYAPLNNDAPPQTLRIELKGFCLPAEQAARARTLEGLQWFAGFLKNPDALAGIEITPEMRSLRSRIIALVYRAWEKEQTLLALSPRHQNKEGYKETIATLGSRMGDLYEKIAAAMRETEQNTAAYKELSDLAQRIDHFKKELKNAFVIMQELRTAIEGSSARAGLRKQIEAAQASLFEELTRQRPAHLP